MHNSQSITAVLPVQNATKVSNTSTDSKANSNFNQVYKNEVANKTKKSPAEPVKNNSANNVKPAANNNTVTAKAKTNEAPASTSQELDRANDDEAEKDVSAQSNLSDPATLISFVGDIITLGHGSRTESEEETKAAALDLSTVDTEKPSPIDTALVVSSNIDSTTINPSSDKASQFSEIQENLNAELSAAKTVVTSDVSLNKSTTSPTTNLQNAPKDALNASVSTSQLAPEINTKQVKEQVELPTARIEQSMIGMVQPKVETVSNASIAPALSDQTANNDIKESGLALANDRNINDTKTDQFDSTKMNRERDPFDIKTTTNNVAVNATKERILPANVSANLEQVIAEAPPSENVPIVDIGKQAVQASTDSIATEIQARDPNKLLKDQANNAMTAFAMNRQDKSINTEMQDVKPKVESTSNLESIPAATTTSAPPVEISPKQVKQEVVDNTDLSQTGLSRSERFAEALSSKFAQVHQEQNLQQKSTAIEEFVINNQHQEIATPPAAAQVATTAVNNLPATEHIAARFGTKAWDQAIGQKIVWMVAGGEQSAQLTLNPPDLGPVQVVLSISDNFVDASFVSSHLDVREAIEAAAPQLREMMDNAGISLSGFSVSAESAQNGNPFSSSQSGSGANSQSRSFSKLDSQADTIASNTPTARPKQELGLVDTFA